MPPLRRGLPPKSSCFANSIRKNRYWQPLCRASRSAAFPPALTVNGNEPLAADLRPEGDGQQLGFLKIVAGIAGVPLDALIQRDAQRRVRRVTAITGGALAAMLIMGIMTAYAIQARNEAARQRAAAEGLVEYMLTDLREKLKGVGRLDVQTAVNRKMITHYRAQGRIETLAEDSLERRARVLHAMGEDFEMSGELDDASLVFKQAKDATGALLARKPDDPERIFTHAQSEYWVGYAALLKNDYQTAEEQAAKYQRLAEKLLRVHPDQVVAMKEVGWAANFLGVVKLYGRDNPAGALKQFLKYRTIFADLVETHSDDTEALRSLSMAHALIAEAYLTMGNENKSLHHRKLEQGIVDQLYENDPQNAQIWMLSIIRNRDIARILIRKKDFRNAERYLVQAEDWSAKLVRLDRRNAAWRLQDALNLIVRVTLDHNIEAPNANRNSTKLRELISDQVFLKTLRDQDRTYLNSRAAEALRQI